MPAFLKSKSFWAFVTNLVAVASAFFLNANIPDPPAPILADGSFDPSLPKGDILTWIVFGQGILAFLLNLFSKKEEPPKPPLDPPHNLRVVG